MRGKIFITVPPDEEHVHVFVPEQQRDQALAIDPEFLEKVRWGSKVVGLRVTLANAAPATVKRLISLAWEGKAPKSLMKSAGQLTPPRRPSASQIRTAGS